MTGSRPAYLQLPVLQWLLPLLALIAGAVAGAIEYTGLTENSLLYLLAALFTSLVFAVAGLVALLMGLIRYRRIEHSRKGWHLAAGVLLNGILISAPILYGVGESLDRIEMEKHNKACTEVKMLEMDILRYQQIHDQWPSESAGLGALDEITSASGLDPWGRPYLYRLEALPESGGKPTQQPRVWSVGPDGHSGTNDDIGRTTQQKRRPSMHWPAP